MTFMAARPGHFAESQRKNVIFLCSQNPANFLISANSCSASMAGITTELEIL
jgi:hypothetical protein